MKKKILCFLIFLFILSCTSTPEKSVQEYIDGEPAFHLKNYSFDPESSLESRCTKTPELILISLRKMLKRDDYNDYSITDEERKIVNVESYIRDYLKMEIKEKEFTKGVWKDYSLPLNQYNYKLRNKVTFYGNKKGSKIKLSQSMRVYKQLSQTPFASLYSSKIWPDDFAEYVTFYHLSQKMGLPFKINIYNKGELIYSYEPMKSALVKTRFPLMEKFY